MIVDSLGDGPSHDREGNLAQLPTGPGNVCPGQNRIRLNKVRQMAVCLNLLTVPSNLSHDEDIRRRSGLFDSDGWDALCRPTVPSYLSHLEELPVQRSPGQHASVHSGPHTVVLADRGGVDRRAAGLARVRTRHATRSPVRRRSPDNDAR
jgi:hypothetical protein